MRESEQTDQKLYLVPMFLPEGAQGALGLGVRALADKRPVLHEVVRIRVKLTLNETLSL